MVPRQACDIYWLGDLAVPVNVRPTAFLLGFISKVLKLKRLQDTLAAFSAFEQIC